MGEGVRSTLVVRPGRWLVARCLQRQNLKGQAGYECRKEAASR